MCQYEKHANWSEDRRARTHAAWHKHVGKWREQLVVINVMIGLVLIVGMAIVIWRPVLFFSHPDARLVVGQVPDFPPGSVTSMTLETTFVDPVALAFQQRATVSPVPIFLVHDPVEGFFVWFNRDTHSACRIAWVEADELFIDPCHGSTFTRIGIYKGGPAPRSLDRFGVTTDADGRIIVDMRAFQPGTSVH